MRQTGPARNGTDGVADKLTIQGDFRVGDHLVQPGANTLVGAGGEIHLEPKSMEVLLVLAARPGEVIGREELLAAVWPGVHVGDESLTAAIIKLRRALGDDARQPRFVETIPKRGYRLIAPVEPVTGDRVAPRAAGRAVLAAAVLAGVVVLAGLYLGAGPSRNAAPGPAATVPRGDRVALAVAPFVNAGGDPAQDYLARGLGESILNGLAGHPGLAVFRGDQGAGQAPGYVLEGSVLRSGDTLRVDARLVVAGSGEVLFSNRFERPFDDLMAVEDRIAAEVQKRLSREIAAAERSRRARGYTDNLAAYDLFLRAQAQLVRRTEPANRAARGLYLQAIAADPDFARAYGGLALTYAAEYRNGWAADRDAALAAALRYASTAIGIAPDLPEQLWVVGYVRTQERRFDDALEVLRKAVAVAPDYADAYALSGGIETYRGNPAASIPLLREAMRLNPGAGYLYFLLLARAYYFTGDYEQALINLDEALRRNPENLEAHLYRAAALLHQDDAGEAGWEAEEVLNLEPGFTLAGWRAGYPMAPGAQIDALIGDLSAAGLS